MSSDPVTQTFVTRWGHRLPAPIADLLRPVVRAARNVRRGPPRSAAATELEKHDLLGALSNDLTGVAPFLRWAPPGHFYSPIPDLRAIDADAARLFDRSSVAVPGIDIAGDEQLELLATFSEILADWSFPHEADGERRYFSGTGNFAYGIGDAMMLHAMLRHARPRRLIEVGSGFSSCMTLDTNELFLDGSMAITFIEPYPELLYSLIGDGERDGIDVHECRLQDVPDEVFTALEAGDVLFIDSTHVARVGSDVVDIFARVLPLVAPGVLIHLHDVFWPFEYPESWVREGRAWTEIYLLRSFLQFNDSFEILLFNDYLATVHGDAIARLVPRMQENTGGSIWLRRRA
jgi:predicted O-methyltransferase YrrM